jgi:hypothetical protein
MLAGYLAPFSLAPELAGGYINSSSFLTLTKQFRGLELQQPVRMLEMTPRHATLQVTDPMLIPLLEGTVTLHSQAFAKPIVGHIQNMLDAEGTFSLSNFNEFDWRARRSDRVQPEDLVYVKMHCKHKTARLRLDDLSAQGMGIVADHEVIEQGKFIPGQAVKLDFTLSGISFSDLPARVLYRVRLGRWLEKLGLQLLPLAMQRRKLEQYVTHRKAEILEEVSQIYLQSREPRGIESLYF